MMKIDGKAVTGKEKCDNCQYFKANVIDYGIGKFGIVCENEGLCNKLEKINRKGTE